MAKVSVSKLSTGAFQVQVYNNVYFLSNPQYAAFPEGVKIISLPGQPVVNAMPVEPIDWVVNDQGGYTTVEQVCQALSALGVGGSGYNIPATFANGHISLTAEPDDQDTVTIDDGTNTAVVFEFTGKRSVGAVSFANDGTPGNPANEDTIVFDDDGDNETTFEFDSGASASGALEFTDGEEPANPDDFDLLSLGDDAHFIFLDTPAGETDYTEVEIGEDADATMVNFITAFNALDIPFTAVAANPADNTCTVNADAVGSESNLLWVASGDNFDVTSLTGGINAGDDITEGNIGVVIGADEDETMENFIEKFNATIAFPGWTAYPSDTPDHECSIIADQVGDEYDVTITKSGDNITVTSPTGGIDAEENLTEGNIPVVVQMHNRDTLKDLAEIINEVKEDGDLLVTAYYNGTRVNLQHLTLGTAGNQSLAKSGDAITVGNLQGGAAEVTLQTLIDAVNA